MKGQSLIELSRTLSGEGKRTVSQAENWVKSEKVPQTRFPVTGFPGGRAKGLTDKIP